MNLHVAMAIECIPPTRFAFPTLTLRCQLELEESTQANEALNRSTTALREQALMRSHQDACLWETRPEHMFCLLCE